MSHCWEIRGCDEEMQSRCPHNLANDNCPPDCHFASCDRPTHAVTSNFDLLFRTDIDRNSNVKDICSFCEFFLSHAPSTESANTDDQAVDTKVANA